MKNYSINSTLKSWSKLNFEWSPDNGWYYFLWHPTANCKGNIYSLRWTTSLASVLEYSSGSPRRCQILTLYSKPHQRVETYKITHLIICSSCNSLMSESACKSLHYWIVKNMRGIICLARYVHFRTTRGWTCKQKPPKNKEKGKTKLH